MTIVGKPTAGPGPSPRPLRTLLRHRGVWLTAVAWLAGNAVVVAASGDRLPFDWATGTGRSATGHLVDANLALAEVLALIALTWWLTRRRPAPDLADRAPQRATAARETWWLLLYGAAGLGVGFAVGRSAGWHPFGLHLAGSVYGTHEHVTPAETVTWATYNLLVYAVVPLLYFRRRYPAKALNLRSSNRRADAMLIGVILVIETLVQIAALDPEIFDLSPGQLAIGIPLTFVLYLAGTVFPAMVFIYAILVPRLLRLTGSAVTTVILCGVTYTVLHLWDAWTVTDSPGSGTLSLIFLFFTYFAPGMFKAVLTVRTGNAWVHVWAYHALAPHTLVDTPHVAQVFRLR